MAKEIRVTVEAVLEVPNDWKPSEDKFGTSLVTPDGKEVGFLVALEYDYESAGLTILETDEKMQKVGCQVISYGRTDIEE